MDWLDGKCPEKYFLWTPWSVSINAIEYGMSSLIRGYLLENLIFRKKSRSNTGREVYAFINELKKLAAKRERAA